MTNAMAPSPDHAPIAVDLLSGSKAPWIRARLLGVSSAAATPWRMRAMIRTRALGAMPHSSEPTAKPIVPMRKIRRRP
jgi:hypothetical protein